ncbi:MAG: hypothetical protein HC811_12290 [Flammeovirgaceae bacterium]|nr:hypothetical protein [Flammeovirgaceae bacterium]
MNKFFSGILLLVVISTVSLSAQSLLSLEDIIQRAKEQSPSSKQAETRKENRYWTYRNFRSNYKSSVTA